jgi:hypothetical protein
MLAGVVGCEYTPEARLKEMEIKEASISASTPFLGVRNAILAGGEKNEETGPRRWKIMGNDACRMYVYATQHRSRCTDT